jgi:hypothetical protein
MMRSINETGNRKMAKGKTAKGKSAVKSSSSKELAFFSSGSMPVAASVVAKNLAAVGAQRGSKLNKPLLRFTKSGEWVFGADNEELDDGARLAVNPASFKVGYIAWNGGAVAGEKMVALGQVLNSEDLPEVDSETGWQPQISVDLAGLTADKSGFRDEYVFKTTSNGGRDCLMDLAAELSEELENNSGRIPVVELSSESYRHKKYGTVHKPVLKLVEWIKA